MIRIKRAEETDKTDQGFALVLALSLLAFILVLILTFSSLIHVAAQSASLSRRQLIARCNAHFALSIALGELQKTAGPDQRVTATADLASEDDLGETYQPGNNAEPFNATVANGLATPRPGTRYWTGVWGNEDAADNAYSATPTPRLLNWLVSGNEGSAFSASESAGDFGRIELTGNPPLFNPSDVFGVSASTSASSTTIDFGLGVEGVLLLGKGTVGEAADARRQYDPASTTEMPPETRYVAAPLVDIQSDSGTVGRYAWWVGDEGVKARINLNESVEDLNNSTYLNGFVSSCEDVMARARYAGPARNGVELISGLDNLARPQESLSQLESLFSNSQIPMYDPLSTTALADTVKARYHDITLHSSGVIADTLRGGLRKDLTYSLANSKSPLGGGTLLDEMGAPSPAFGPTWDRVKSFWKLAPDWPPDDTTYGKYNVRIGSRDQVGIAPIISKFRFVSTAEIRYNRGSYYLRGLNGIYLVLGNPYRNAIYMPKDTYDLSMRRSAGNIGTLSLIMTIVDRSTGLHVGASPYQLSLINGSTGAFDRWTMRMRDGSIHFCQDWFSKGNEMVRNFSNMIDMLDYAKNPHLNMKVFEPVPAIAITPPAKGETYAISMELVETGNLKIDVLLHERGNQNRVLQGIYNYDLAGSPGIGSGDQLWVGGTPTYHFIPSAEPASTKGTDNLSGAVAGGYTLLLNAAGNTPFYTEPSGGSFYQTAADANMLSSQFTDAGGTRGDDPASVFGYHGGYTIPDNNTSPRSTMKNCFIDTTESSGNVVNGYTLRAWGRRTSYHSGEEAIYSMLPMRRTDMSAGDYPFLSIADLRGVNLSGDDEHYSVGHQPVNIVGNSYHNVFVPRDSVEHTMAKRSGGSRNYFDMSYLLNTSLWDRYFFSTIPQLGRDITPVNRRFTMRQDANRALDDADFRDQDKAAANLSIAGAFNINSTSPEAWRAVLGAMNGVPLVGSQTNDYTRPDTDDMDAAGASFPRYSGELTYKTSGTSISSREQIKRGTYGPAYKNRRASNPAWWFSHRLNEDELVQLSEDIAREVRKRGPFLSLSHFINRSLSTDDLGRAGALQAALDVTRGIIETDINSYLSSTQQIPWDGDGFYAEPLDTADPTAPGSNHHANRMKGLPGWVMQGDLLGSLGSVISARSDTFVIRVYGDATNAVTGAVEARAYYEAQVQRLPEFVDASDAPETEISDLSNVNKRFGRRFAVLSVRSLSSEDI